MTSSIEVPHHDLELPMEFYPRDFAEHYRAAGFWTDATFAEFIPDAARRFGDSEAVVGRDFRGQEARYSYAELDAATAELASGLAAHDIRPGDRVLVQLPNITDYAVVVFGLFRLGALPVFCLPAHRESEIEHFITTAKASAFITVGEFGGFDHRALARKGLASLSERGETQVPLVIVADEDPGEFVSLGAVRGSAVMGEDAPARPDPEGLAFLQLSGGTTGTPKLIPRTHADYLYSIREQAAIAGCSEATRMLVVLPAAHNFTMSSPGIIGVLIHGGTVVFCSDPTPTAAFTAIEAERCTMVSLVPPLALTWLATRSMIDKDLTSLKVMQVGGAKFPEVAARRIGPELGATVQQVFGMAEGLCNFTRLDDPEDLRASTQGHPVSPGDEIEIRNDAGELVAPGERGNLWTRGPYTIRGYLGGVDSESFDDRGFYCSGDIVRRLDNGYLVVEGRAKDQINRGGEKISAEEIENHLLAHPEVVDVALVAVPDKFLGERSCAYVISAAPPSAEQLKSFVRERGVAEYKVPDRFEFADAFPSTGVGKTSRRELRRYLSDLLG